MKFKIELIVYSGFSCFLYDMEYLHFLIHCFKLDTDDIMYV